MNRSTAYISLLVAVIGLVGAIITLATQVGAFGNYRIPGLPRAAIQEEFSACNRALMDPEISITKGRGTSGTRLTVSGDGFCPDERVTIRFHTEDIAVARTGSDGRFSVVARIPGSFDAFAPMQLQIVANGPAGSAKVPFQLKAQ